MLPAPVTIILFLIYYLFIFLIVLFIAGHKGPGSVFATLQDKGWAMSNSAGKRLQDRRTWDSLSVINMKIWSSYSLNFSSLWFHKKCTSCRNLTEKWRMFIKFHLSKLFYTSVTQSEYNLMHLLTLRYTPGPFLSPPLHLLSHFFSNLTSLFLFLFYF